ncbi:uncharacterized protein LOC119114021 [Pollicipes pollicipes]|uniref:uncharacterized protein LOC119114021 n=1 Tax=Pollicipes pollicipes TaxID=41117 RepID=UPI001885A0D8|nr:uncharacterized protein LOC119114021 [Pollicipes pollicipes]
MSEDGGADERTDRKKPLMVLQLSGGDPSETNEEDEVARVVLKRDSVGKNVESQANRRLRLIMRDFGRSDGQHTDAEAWKEVQEELGPDGRRKEGDRLYWTRPMVMAMLAGLRPHMWALTDRGGLPRGALCPQRRQAFYAANDSLAAAGYHVAPKDVLQKWQNMFATYKRIMAREAESGVFNTHWEFYDDMKELMAERSPRRPESGEDAEPDLAAAAPPAPTPAPAPSAIQGVLVIPAAALPVASGSPLKPAKRPRVD